MLFAAYLTTAFVVAAVGAYHLLKAPHNPLARTMFSMAMWMAAIVTPLQIVAGDFHGLNTLEHQPAKIAAMEGHFETHQARHSYSLAYQMKRIQDGLCVEFLSWAA
ncbi:putative cytochrome bd2 subunit I [Vibrio astriarenae]|nr:putative cytochrome bd2 subunit I [Vibrio sp. C7]